jgi:hypothetical protein
MLLNYMVTSSIPVQTRWNTFAMFVQQGGTAAEQNLIVAGIMALNNAAEDAALKAWRWTPADQTEAVNAMAANTAPANWYKAYQTLAAYKYPTQARLDQGKPLPLKVGAAVAQKFIAKI